MPRRAEFIALALAVQLAAVMAQQMTFQEWEQIASTCMYRKNRGDCNGLGVLGDRSCFWHQGVGGGENFRGCYPKDPKPAEQISAEEYGELMKKCASFNKQKDECRNLQDSMGGYVCTWNKQRELCYLNQQFSAQKPTTPPVSSPYSEWKETKRHCRSILKDYGNDGSAICEQDDNCEMSNGKCVPKETQPDTPAPTLQPTGGNKEELYGKIEALCRTMKFADGCNSLRTVYTSGTSCKWKRKRGYCEPKMNNPNEGSPTKEPVANPTKKPVGKPTKQPVSNPTKQPVGKPTKKPTPKPTKKPTKTAPPKNRPSEWEEYDDAFALCATKNDEGKNACKGVSDGNGLKCMYKAGGLCIPRSVDEPVGWYKP